MRSQDWRMMGNICIVLGLIFLAGGAWIWLNVNAYFGIRAWLEYYGYSGYSFLLLFLGIVLFIVGFFLLQRASEEERKTETKEEFKEKDLKFCLYCGEKMRKDAQFCPICGKKQL